jgi:hypothetical membrane protein
MNSALQKLYQKVPFYSWGLIGSLIIILGIIITAIAYAGQDGESYSLFNHFISELGELKNSELAVVFNLGLILGGIAYIPFMAGLGIYSQQKLGKVASIIAIVASICCSLVGIFPMDYLAPHMVVAFGFFYLGMVAIFLFTICIIRDKENLMPKWLIIIGLCVVASFASFLFLPLDFSEMSGMFSGARADFILLAFLEWLVLITVEAWILIVAVYLKKMNARLL